MREFLSLSNTLILENGDEGIRFYGLWRRESCLDTNSPLERNERYCCSNLGMPGKSAYARVHGCSPTSRKPSQMRCPIVVLVAATWLLAWFVTCTPVCRHPAQVLHQHQALRGGGPVFAHAAVLSALPGTRFSAPLHHRQAHKAGLCEWCLLCVRRLLGPGVVRELRKELLLVMLFSGLCSCIEVARPPPHGALCPVHCARCPTHTKVQAPESRPRLRMGRDGRYARSVISAWKYHRGRGGW